MLGGWGGVRGLEIKFLVLGEKAKVERWEDLARNGRRTVYLIWGKEKGRQ